MDAVVVAVTLVSLFVLAVWLTREEADFFRALGVPWTEPGDRHAESLRFDPEILRGQP